MTIAIERALAETTLPLDVIRHCIMPYTHKDWKPSMDKVFSEMEGIGNLPTDLAPRRSRIKPWTRSSHMLRVLKHRAGK